MKETVKENDSQNKRETDSVRERQTEKGKYRQKERTTDRERERQTEKEKYRQRQRKTDRDREGQAETDTKSKIKTTHTSVFCSFFFNGCNNILLIGHKTVIFFSDLNL